MSALMDKSGVKFGTSGARGLVRALTDEICYALTTAFLQHLVGGNGSRKPTDVGIAGDLRSSTGRMMAAVTRACLDFGHRPLNCGRIPTPALALFGLERAIPTIMVTGSHIPDDRNGIKFNTPLGEILKHDEAGIKRQQIALPDLFDEGGMLLPQAVSAPLTLVEEAERLYVRRFLSAFPDALFEGKRIGVYGHSAVGREILCEILRALGAEVVRLGFSDTFIPVDTEAIRPVDMELAVRWAQQHTLMAIVSTDGDSDRPLVSDENGVWLRGDVAGILCAKFVRADVVVTPVSSNTAVERSGFFPRVARTRIGSPFVIEAMQRAVADGGKCVVGYEANGGFLTSSPIELPGGSLSPLPTRDAIIVILGILSIAVKDDVAISTVLGRLPSRHTASDRLTDFPTERSAAIVHRLTGLDPVELSAALGGSFGRATAVDTTDGLRITFDSGDIVHLRPSGNAPELRCYAEGDTEQRAREIASTVLQLVRTVFGTSPVFP